MKFPSSQSAQVCVGPLFFGKQRRTLVDSSSSFTNTWPFWTSSNIFATYVPRTFRNTARLNRIPNRRTANPTAAFLWHSWWNPRRGRQFQWTVNHRFCDDFAPKRVKFWKTQLNIFFRWAQPCGWYRYSGCVSGSLRCFSMVLSKPNIIFPNFHLFFQ